ncbi:MAG: NUDIX hydrolase [Actinobacteria bacterium]|nr:NUDIX hydrolase [Actinomycetota bacterium]
MGILDGWRFCPRCAGPLRPGDGRVTCDACGFVRYANPVPGAQALLEENGRVLLGRRGREPGAGLWDIPGGFIDETEHPVDALRREFREETGLDVEPVDFLGIWMQRYDEATVLCLTWTARRLGGAARAGDDLVELGWFGPEELPPAGELAFETFVDILSVWRGRNEHA